LVEVEGGRGRAGEMEKEGRGRRKRGGRGSRK
jgi:hypothetical protein